MTLKVHCELGLKSADARLMLFDPEAAVIVPPPQPPLWPFGDEITSPDGSVSVNPMPVNRVDALGLLMAKVSVVVPSSVIDDAPNVFVMVGGATTIRLAVLLLTPGPVSLDETAPVVLV